MAKTIIKTFGLGQAKAGLAATLRASLVNDVGAILAAPHRDIINGGGNTYFFDEGRGNYLFVYKAAPDGFTGGVNVHETAVGAASDFSAANPLALASVPIESALSGNGPHILRVTVRDENAALLPGASVSAVGPSTATGTTNALGYVDFGLFPGQYDFAVAYPNKQSAPVLDWDVPAEGLAFTVSMTALTAPSAPPPGKVTVYGTVLKNGDPVPGARLEFRQKDGPGIAGYAIVREIFRITADGAGFVQIPLPVNSAYEARLPGGEWHPFDTGTGPNTPIQETLGKLYT